jgi:glucokinase
MGYTIGFDLGATKMLCLVLDGNYKIAARLKRRTSGQGDSEKVFSNILHCVEDCLEAAKIPRTEIRAAGFGVPGPIDFENGIVLDTPNIGLKNFPLRKLAEKEFGFPVLVENDVNAGTYAEVKRGAAAGLKHVIGLFPGTGLGAGLILDGKIYRGAAGGAGEIGHMIVQIDGPLCGCGGYGCLEALVSRTAIVKDVVQLAATGRAQTVFKKAGVDFLRVKSGVLAKAVEEGDAAVVKVIERAAWNLGIGMSNCVNIFNPEAIVLGGGLVEKFGAEYLKIAEESMRKHALPGLSAGVKVLIAKNGDDVVGLGMSLLVNEWVKDPK